VACIVGKHGLRHTIRRLRLRGHASETTWVIVTATISRPKLSVKLLRLLGFFKLLAQTCWHENQRPVRRVIVFGQRERFRNDCLHVLPQHGHVEG
jgi:hypothetical protein